MNNPDREITMRKVAHILGHAGQVFLEELRDMGKRVPGSSVQAELKDEAVQVKVHFPHCARIMLRIDETMVSDGEKRRLRESGTLLAMALEIEAVANYSISQSPNGKLAAPSI